MSLFRDKIIETMQSGWTLLSLEGVNPDGRELLDELHPLGTVRPSRRSSSSAVDALVPTQQALSKLSSLSAQFGVGEFPYHIDGTHLPIPPRFLLMYCIVDEQGRPTRLLRWEAIRHQIQDAGLLDREVFFFRNGRRSFADSISAPHRDFIRFDPGCMVPGTRRAQHLLDKIDLTLKNLIPFEVNWTPGRALLIDNWQILHGRGNALREGERRLLRLQFDPFQMLL